jgi:hypothetical protein
LFYSSLWLLLIVWAWWKLVVRLTTGEGFLFARAPRPQKEIKTAPARAATLPIFLRRLPPDIAQIMSKEFKSIWRTPLRRVGLIQGLLAPIFMGGFILIRNESSISSLTSFNFIGLGLPLYALFIYWVTSFNMLGWEGKGLPVLFLTPVSRRRIFLGKGLALYIVASLSFLLVGIIFTLVLGNWVSLGGLLTGLLSGFTTIGVTAVFATLFPSPINQESRRRRSSLSTRGGCLPALANLFLLLPLIFIMAIPVAVPLLLAYFFDLPWVMFVALPLSLAYALPIFWLGCRHSASLLATREPEVLAATRVED